MKPTLETCGPLLVPVDETGCAAGRPEDTSPEYVWTGKAKPRRRGDPWRADAVRIVPDRVGRVGPSVVDVPGAC